MRKFGVIAITLCVLVLILLAGSGQVQTQAQATEQATQLGTAKDLEVTDAEIAAAKTALGSSVVGVVACTLETEYHSTVANGAVKQLEAYGLKAEVFDSQAKIDREISGIESLVAKGAKILIVCDLDPKASAKTLQDAKAKGTEIIQFAGRQAADLGGITISIEDADLGYAAGEYAGQLITKELGGKAKVAILDYPDLPQVVIRADNIEKALKKEAPNAEIVGRFLGGTPDNGLKSLESALQKTPDINVIVSINDAGALGALKALEGAGKKPGDVIVVGIDAEKQAKENILKGNFFRGTVDTSPDITAVMTAQAAVKILAKSKFPQNIVVPVTLVTKESLEKAMASATAAPTMAATAAAASSMKVSNGKYDLEVTKVERVSEWGQAKPQNAGDIIVVVSFETSDPGFKGVGACGALQDNAGGSWKAAGVGLGMRDEKIITTSCAFAIPKTLSSVDWRARDYPAITLNF